MWDYFSWSVAVRNLRTNIRQSLLTVGIVGTSVTLIIFITALISGLERRLLTNVTDAIAHIIIRPAERLPIPAWKLQTAADEEAFYVADTVKLEQRKRKIEEWPAWLSRLGDYDPEILAVSPVVEGQGIVSRGEKRKGVMVTGVVPERHNQVVDIQSKLVRGRFFGLNAGEVALGWKLADEFALQLGDKIRIVSSEDIEGNYIVSGIFDSGFGAVDSGTVFLQLRDAQSLFGLGTAVTSIGLKLNHIFEADAIASRMAMQIPYEARSWMQDNQSLLSGLRAQSQSSELIVVFTTIASGLGIAAILVMAVVSKLRELGILKAMGASRSQILAVFAIQGTLLSAIGGILGSAAGIALCLFLGRFRSPASVTGRLVEAFPMNLTAGIVSQAMVIALTVGFVASLYPAWRASRVNAIEVIRSA